MIKNVLFDLDGTLIDSKEANIYFVKKFFNEEALGEVSIEDSLKFHYMTIRDFVRYYLKDTSEEKQSEITKRFLDFPYPFHLLKQMDGAAEVLSELENKYKLSIVSGSERYHILKMLETFDLEKYFSIIVAAGDYENSKPDPEPINMALKKLSANPLESIYVGDSGVDIEAARAAGIGVIILGELGGADFNIKSLRETPAILNNL